MPGSFYSLHFPWETVLCFQGVDELSDHVLNKDIKEKGRYLKLLELQAGAEGF